MRKRRTSFAGVAIALLALSSCGTTHAVRWTYGQPSCYDDADEATNDPDGEPYPSVLRAIVGIPFIVGSAAFDVVTFPAQAIVGVWPWWGDDSLHLVPEAAPPAK